jgi:hypothetical protein
MLSRARTISLITLLTLVTLPGLSHAQGKGAWEIGFDAGLTVQKFSDDDPNTDDPTDVAIGFPAQQTGSVQAFSLQTIRAAVYVLNKSEIEIDGGFTFNSFFDGDSTFTQIGLGVFWLQNFADSSASVTPFVKGGGLYRLFAGSDETVSQNGLLAGGGFKFRVADHLAIRTQAGVSRWFNKEELPRHWDFTLSVGLSLFTR